MASKHILGIISEDRSRLEVRQVIAPHKKYIRAAIAAAIALILTTIALIRGTATQTLACEPERTELRTYTCILERGNLLNQQRPRAYTAIAGLRSYGDSLVMLDNPEQNFPLTLRAPDDLAARFASARRENAPLTLTDKAPLTVPLLLIGLAALPFWYLALRALRLQGSWAIFDSAQGTVAYRSEGIWKVRQGQARLEAIDKIALRTQSTTKVGARTTNQTLALDMHLNDMALPLMLGNIYGKAKHLEDTRAQARELQQRLTRWLAQTRKAKLHDAINPQSKP